MSTPQTELQAVSYLHSEVRTMHTCKEIPFHFCKKKRRKIHTWSLFALTTIKKHDDRSGTFFITTGVTGLGKKVKANLTKL